MSLLHTGERICASCGGIRHHQPACSRGDSIEVIPRPTLAWQAIEDGILVDSASKLQSVRFAASFGVAAGDDRRSYFTRYVWPIDEAKATAARQNWKAGSLGCLVSMFHAAVKGTVPCHRIYRATGCFDSLSSFLIRHMRQREGQNTTASGPKGMRQLTLKRSRA